MGTDAMKQITIALLMLFCLHCQVGCDVHANTTNATTSNTPSGSTPKPIMTGTQTIGSTLKLYRKPVDTSSGSNSAWLAPEGSRVEVYEDFIIVTAPEKDGGLTRISHHGYYTGLAIKKD